MIGNFNDAKETPNNKFADSALGKKSEGSVLDKFAYIANKALAVMCDGIKCCPIENGEWTGERGNSKWCPDKNYVPLKANLEGKTWGEILKKFGIDGIYFKDGEPDFGPISKGNVEIKGFSDDRTDNFDKADIELAKQKGCSPEDVKRWRKENGYTWHECRDMKTMQKVPSIVHNNISHSGGISEAKKGA